MKWVISLNVFARKWLVDSCKFDKKKKCCWHYRCVVRYFNTKVKLKETKNPNKWKKKKRNQKTHEKRVLCVTLRVVARVRPRSRLAHIQHLTQLQRLADILFRIRIYYVRCLGDLLVYAAFIRAAAEWFLPFLCNLRCLMSIFELHYEWRHTAADWRKSMRIGINASETEYLFIRIKSNDNNTYSTENWPKVFSLWRTFHGFDR